MPSDSFPMTPNGLRRLREELKRIKEVDRPENVQEIATAREHGDISENAEYAAAKERQSALDLRMRYLEFRIAKAQVLDPAEIRAERAAFGATVTLTDLENDEELVYALVGEDEADATRGRISINSPIARALIGKSEGDEISVQLPRGSREFAVLRIEYKALDE